MFSHTNMTFSVHVPPDQNDLSRIGKAQLPPSHLWLLTAESTGAKWPQITVHSCIVAQEWTEGVKPKRHSVWHSNSG